ncbi:hypothetical protein SAMN04488527_102227 [Aliiroseovarius crassostreae]|uniref:Uncharacterized protein n=1 Tax=Aliiroseovarius crassostreae TaxID=154981 RepID=A0A0P7IVV5_9RHOB|nr:hypothetical protein [Aliiroseovarius crassostreae]KPN63407.1 hypothetical protein AKJ29_12135 [Aliiroseovarius crassostreae]SFU43162.1 hypothetical protein SAMN04488527_102227 [Aliiroseovarius crassostreae]
MTYLHSQAAKAEMKKAMNVGTTSAKTANAPKKKMTKAAQATVQKAKAANEKWERPSLVAIHRMMAGSDLKAGVLLHHIVFEWGNRNKKLERDGREWLAHSRDAWAQAAGLTFAEFKNTAEPRLKKSCAGFLTMRAMGNGSDKKLWVADDYRRGEFGPDTLATIHDLAPKLDRVDLYRSDSRTPD